MLECHQKPSSMKETSIDLYSCLDPGEHVVVTATLTEDGILTIHDFDGSKAAHERYWSDIESWLILEKDALNLLVQKVGAEMEIENREDLLNWLKVSFSGIGAQYTLKRLCEKHEIPTSERSWPFG